METPEEITSVVVAVEDNVETSVVVTVAMAVAVVPVVTV